MTPKKKDAVDAPSFLTTEALRQTVAEAIARLELDRHQIRLAVMMHGKDVTVGEGETAEQATERINTAIEEIATEYADVLKVGEE